MTRRSWFLAIWPATEPVAPTASFGGLYLRTTATDLGFNISSEGNDDLTELAAVLQIAVHFHHIVELECAIDHRLERATREAVGDVLHCDLSACLVGRHQPDAVPLDRWHLADHLQHRYRGVTLAQCAVDVGDALIGQRGDQLGKVWAAYRIEGNARAIAVRDAHHFGDPRLLLRSARQRDGGRTGILSNLNRRQADAARSCGNDDEVARFHLSVEDERAVGRYKHHPD